MYMPIMMMIIMYIDMTSCNMI